MQKPERIKSCLVVALFAAAFFLCLLAFVIGTVRLDFHTWDVTWDWKTGGIAAAATFGTFSLAAAILLLTIRHPSWFLVFLPLAVAFLYNLTPDPIPGSFDDAIIWFFGAGLTVLLWLRRRPGTSLWILLPLGLGLLCTLLGMFIPGPFDEFILLGTLTAASLLVGFLVPPKAPPASTQPPPDGI